LTSDIKDEHKLSNGAEVSRTSYDCEVCVHRNEEPSKSEFRIDYEMQQLEICAAHMQEVLDSDDEGKEGILEEFFGIDAEEAENL